MKLNEFVRSRRDELGLSQQDVADRIGVSKASVFKYESGEIPIEKLSLVRIEQLAKALYIDPVFFISYMMNPEKATADAEMQDICRMLSQSTEKTRSIIKGMLIMAAHNSPEGDSLKKGTA
jgi:transcriptional regulator with XRE-family HTH domain